MFKGFGNSKQHDEIDKWYNQMKDEVVQPDEATFNIIIWQFAKSGSAEKVYHYWNEVKKRNGNPFIPYHILIVDFSLPTLLLY